MFENDPMWQILPWFYIFWYLSQRKYVSEDIQKTIDARTNMSIFNRQIAFNQSLDAKNLPHQKIKKNGKPIIKLLHYWKYQKITILDIPSRQYYQSIFL